MVGSRRSNGSEETVCWQGLLALHLKQLDYNSLSHTLPHRSHLHLAPPTPQRIIIWYRHSSHNPCFVIANAVAAVAAILQVIGTIDGSGRVKLVDKQAEPGTPTPVDLNLDQVLGKMPNKTFTFNTSTPTLEPLTLPEGTTPQVGPAGPECCNLPCFCL